MIPKPGEKGLLPSGMIVFPCGALLDDSADVFAVGVGGELEVVLKGIGVVAMLASLQRFYAWVDGGRSAGNGLKV